MRKGVDNITELWCLFPPLAPTLPVHNSGVIQADKLPSQQVGKAGV